MERFGNAALGHRTLQIAQDGSQKIPQRLLAPIADRLERGLPIEALSLAVAAWMRWQQRGDVDDPLAAQTHRAATSPDPVNALLALDAIFPPDLAANPEFRAAIGRQFNSLDCSGC